MATRAGKPAGFEPVREVSVRRVSVGSTRGSRGVNDVSEGLTRSLRGVYERFPKGLDGIYEESTRDLRGLKSRGSRRTRHGIFLPHPFWILFF